MPKFAANLSTMFGETSFLDRFAAARNAGFDAVELMFPYAFDVDDLGNRLARQEQHLVLFNLPAGDWNAGERGFACDPRRMAEFQDSVGAALEYAVELQVPQLHCMAGKLPPKVSAARAHEVFVENLRFAASAAREHEVRLLIEPINTFDVPGYFLSGSRQALAIIDEVGATNLMLQYDVYHMQRMEGELAATLEKLMPRIGHIQIADNPGRHEPGTGEINYAFLLRQLDRLGYTGYVGCEYNPAAATTDGLGWLAAMAGGNT